MANLFADGFEDGTLNAWDAHNETGGGDLSVAEAAKLHGNYGLSILVNDVTDTVLFDILPSNQTRYRARFYFDPNTITMAEGKKLRPLSIINSSWVRMGHVYFIYSDSLYKIYIHANTDTSNLYSASYTITDAPHCIEIDWFASSGAGNNDGFMTLWIDGIEKETLASIDNDTKLIYIAKFGASDKETNISGTFFLDDFASNNDGTAIGTLPVDLTGTSVNVLTSNASTLDVTVSGATQKLEGTSTNTTTSNAGVLNGVWKLIGTSAVVIATIGVLTLGTTEKLVGTSANVIATTGALTLGTTEKLTGTSANITTTSGVLSLGITEKLSGVSVSTVTTTGVLILGVVEKLSGTSANATSTLGVANNTLSLSGTSANVLSTIGGTLSTFNIYKLLGVSVNSIIADSELNLQYIIAGTSEAYVEAVAGYLDNIYSLSGTSVNIITSNADILSTSSVKKLEGTSVNTLTTSGSLTLGIVEKLSGTSANVLTVSGSLTLGIVEKIKGTSVNTLYISGSLGIGLSLKGTSVNVFSTSAKIKTPKWVKVDKSATVYIAIDGADSTWQPEVDSADTWTSLGRVSSE